MTSSGAEADGDTALDLGQTHAPIVDDSLAPKNGGGKPRDEAPKTHNDDPIAPTSEQPATPLATAAPAPAPAPLSATDDASSLDAGALTQPATHTTTAATPTILQTPQEAQQPSTPLQNPPHILPDEPNHNGAAATGDDHLMTDAMDAAAMQPQPQPFPQAFTPTADTYPSPAPYTPSSVPNLDQQQAYMMMALASMSAAPGAAMSPPPTVTPSQVTLPTALEESYNGLASAGTLQQPVPDKALESFARIEFADSVFQMTTYAVIVGRDQRALTQARRDIKRTDEHKRRVEDNASRGLPPPSPMAHDRSKFSKSYVSEEGGMLGPESDSEQNGSPAKRRKTSTTGSSNQDNDESQENMISNRQYVSHTPGAAAVDLTSLRPSPWHVPFIGIHSPGPNIASKTKAISREHLKISYNQEDGVFEAIPLHKNGFFCEDVHYKSDKVVLRSGDRLQIKDVDFRFIINGVERGRTGAEEYVEEYPKKRFTRGGKEMSFDFVPHGNGELHDTSDELSEVQGSPLELSDLEGYDDEDDEDAEEMESPMKHEHNADQQSEPLLPQIPKKRGPGRPPKNGIMSKREQRLLKKQQQEMARKTLPDASPDEPPIKRKVGRPRKHPLPDNEGDRPEKRKYKPRKPKEDGAEGSDAERRAKEKKEKKVRPKSPPLELKIEDYNEEQLQKPNKNYGVLIDETLTAAGPDGLTLKQIYKRICQKYPWFYFHTETKGWESSVRHNLIGNEAFNKDETTNLWSRVPGVELDAGKKRKATSPDRGLAAQGYGPYSYPYNTQQLPPGAHGFAGRPPSGYQVPGFTAQQQGRPVQQYGNSMSPGQQPAQPLASQPPAPAQLPGYGPPPAPARPQMGAPAPGTYSSPYASRPPPPATPQMKTEDGGGIPTVLGMPGQPLLAAAPSAAAKIASATALQQQLSARPSATPPASAPSRPVIDPRLLTAVVGLKNGLVENLKKARNPKAEGIVMSALNRCIGLKKEATENDKMEAICIKGIRQVIDGFTKTKSPTPGGSTQDALPPVLEAKVLASLNGFKDVSIKALKIRLGEARAEGVALSAVDRVLGLADASIVAPAAEGETVGNLEGVEQHLMKSIRQLLLGMNQKLGS